MIMLTGASFGQTNVNADEYGALHNKVLTVIIKNNLDVGNSTKVKNLLLEELPKIDSRFQTNEISKAIDNLYNNANFKANILNKIDLNQFQNNVLTQLVVDNFVTDNFKNFILKNSDLGLKQLEIEIQKAIKSSQYNSNEKEYLTIYLSVYKHSSEFWSQNGSTGRWQPYAADAVGTILGSWGGPIWAVVQGALVSTAFDEP